MDTTTVSQAEGRRRPVASRSAADDQRGELAALSATVPAPVPGYLVAKRPRRAYGDRAMAAGAAALPLFQTGAQPSVRHAVQAMLNAHALDWSPTQLDNCRGSLLSSTGRFQVWCREDGVISVDRLTTERLASFMAAIADRRRGPGLKASTISKYRTHLRSLARFQATTPGYGSGLADIDRIPLPRMPKERFAPALDRDEEARILEACATVRDRLIIELFLATGVRVSEMAGLLLPNLLLTARPPRITVAGSVHDPDCSKNRRPRQVSFRKTYSSLPRRLTTWIQHDRDPQRLCPRQEVFLATVDGHYGRHLPAPLGLWGYERLCHRVALRAGVHFSPHVLRHTWATRLVDAGVKPIHLMEVGGWSSIDMVQRYYTANDQEVLSAIAAAGA